MFSSSHVTGGATLSILCIYILFSLFKLLADYFCKMSCYLVQNSRSEFSSILNERVFQHAAINYKNNGDNNS